MCVKNLKKALVASVILYAVIFLAASGLMAMFPVDSMNFRMLMPIISTVLTFLVAKYYYFKGIEISSPLKEGLGLGITFAAIAFVIEVPLMVYYFAAEQGWRYFMQWNLMLGYLLTIIVPAVVAYTKTSKK